MENKLFADSELYQKERPSTLTDSQLKSFYKKMAKEILKNKYSESDEKDIVDDLTNLYPFRDSGFEMAKELERWKANADYEIDSEFIGWLESLESEYDDEVQANVKDWVKAHDVKPKFDLGISLTVEIPLYRGNKIGEIVFVTGIKKETAEYYIHQDKDRNGGYVLSYEKVESNCSLTPKSL